MTKNERRVTKKVNPAPEADASKSSGDFDYDRSIVDAVDKSLWQAVFDGDFRISVRCRRCGRWLSDGRSKRRHYGPTCAIKAAAEAVDA